MSLSNPPKSPDTPDQVDALDALLDEYALFSDHDDNDSNTCSSQYQTCVDCGKVVYWSLLTTKKNHEHQNWKNKTCDCGQEADKVAFKAKLLALLVEARIDENEKPLHFDLDEAYSGHYKDGFQSAVATFIHYRERRIKELEKQREAL